jgi:hypothetical protein
MEWTNFLEKRVPSAQKNSEGVLAVEDEYHSHTYKIPIMVSADDPAEIKSEPSKGVVYREVEVVSVSSQPLAGMSKIRKISQEEVVLGVLEEAIAAQKEGQKFSLKDGHKVTLVVYTIIDGKEVLTISSKGS